MKRKITLGGRLTFFVLCILVVVLGVLVFLFRFYDSKFEERLNSAVKTTTLSSAKEAGTLISFNMLVIAPAWDKTAREDGTKEITGVLEKYRESISNAQTGRVVTAIYAFQPNRALLCGVGDVRFEQLFPKGLKLGEDFSRIYGDNVVAATKVMADENEAGYIVVVESMAEYRAARSKMMVLMIAGMGGGLLLAVVLVIFVGRGAARPMIRLSDAARRIADGDLCDIVLEEHSVKEADDLSRSVHTMAQALRNQVVATMRLTDEAARVSRDLAQGMANLATSASQQAAAVAETASTVEEMEKAGKNAAQNASQIVDSAEKTTEVSIRGRQAVDTTSDIIVRIKEDSMEISQKARTLLSSVEEIGNIIRSVNAIAEQSKILAVNASIEAAKAGEYGSGFAVVAQEVKDLAQQSKDATQQITVTLTAIRKAIEEMVATASAGEKRTEKGVKMVANAGAIVNDLSEAIRENSEFANIINAAVNQQALGLTQIAAAIEEISVSATENQDISRKVEKNTRHMNDSLDALAKMVGHWRVGDDGGSKSS